MEEMFWTKIFENKMIQIYHSTFKKMEIIKLYNLENDFRKFEGCYILNLIWNELGELSDYHFYTTDYFLTSTLKRMCIHPLSILYNYKLITDKNIEQRIITWYKNSCQKYQFGIDVLGHEHGENALDLYQSLQSGNNWEECRKFLDDNNRNYDYQKEKIENRYLNMADALLIAQQLKFDPVIDLLINSPKYTIKDFFSQSY